MNGGTLFRLARSAEYAERHRDHYTLFGATLASALSFARGRTRWGGARHLPAFGGPGRIDQFDRAVAAFQRELAAPFGVYVGGLLVLLVERERVVLFADEARAADVWS